MRKLFFYLLFLQLCFSNVNASPAYPNPTEFTQPDGTKITILLKGDEHINWAETMDGYTIIFNDKGFYEYAGLNMDGDLVCSGFIVGNQKDRPEKVMEYLAKSSKNLMFSEKQVEYSRSLKKFLKSQTIQTAFPTKGNRKLICILMDFSDKPFTKTKTDFNNLFNQVNYNTDGATGSVRDFYLENSYNQLDLSVTVLGPFRATQPMAFYGGPNGDARPLITEAVQKTNPFVNYADFDNDNNGYVDGIYVIFGGYGEEAGAPEAAIWSHAWSISPVTLDGKIISSYSCSPELRGNSGTGLTRIGVICHEFGHVLGAPDYYDTNYATGGQYTGTGSWDLMSGGNWNNTGTTPAHHNGFTKTHIYNWATSTVLSSPSFLTLQGAQYNANSFYEYTTTTTSEYYFCENRQKTGFDAFIPGHGLVIYHIHKDIGNGSINATHPQKMYPVCANATTDPGMLPSSYGNINSGGCPFPGTSVKRSFTDFTVPGSKSWGNNNTGKPITNITENITNKTISFDFMGGVSGNPITFNGTALSSSSILLKWTVNPGYPDVLIAYNSSGNFGTPVDSNEYVAGNTIPGGGTVIYKGVIDSFIHSSLAAGMKYYYKAWSVKPENIFSTGVPYEIKTLCTGASLPYTENFNNDALSGCWTIKKNNANVDWRISNTNRAAGSPLELLCEVAINNETTRIITPPINTIGAYQLLFSFKHKLTQAVGATLKIQSSTDGINWNDESWSIAAQTKDSIGEETIITTINNNLNAPSTFISFVLTSGNTASSSYRQLWYIDNISITAPSDCTPPLTQLSNVMVSDNSGTSVSLKCTRGDGSRVLILARKGKEAINTIPLLGTSYNADSILGNGDQIENGVFVVYYGNDSAATIAGLELGETYNFALFELNATGPCYKIPAVKYSVNTISRIWTGTISDNWSTPDNWERNIIPVTTDPVIIPVGCANYPVIDEKVSCKCIQIQNGATLTISDGADVLVEDSIKVGQGVSGEFIINGGLCKTNGKLYTELGCITTISGGTLTINGWDKYYKPGSQIGAKGTINLIGGTITAYGTVLFSLTGVNGTMSGDFIFNVYSNLYINNSAFTNVNGGTINLLGDGGVFASSSALAKAIAYNLNVNVGNDKTYYLCPTGSTKGALVKGNFNIISGKADLTNGTLALSGIDVLGDISIASGAILNCDSVKDANINIAGNWTNSGTFNAGSNTVTLNGNNQLVAGSTTFRNLKKKISVADTLTFTPGNLITVKGTMNLAGVAGQLLTLRSATSGLQWQIDPQGARSLAYLNVQDSYNINATIINAFGINSIDKGNNTNWSFPTTNIIENRLPEEKLNYKLSPNPAGDVLHVICTYESHKMLTIINMEGKVLIQQTISGKKNEVNVSNLPSGTYFVKIVDSKGITTQKLMKL